MVGSFFVTGTDTEVGKTHVTVALLRALVRGGYRAIAMKPVASGAVLQDGVLLNDDVLAHEAASNVEAPLAWRNPYCFVEPMSPHLAARLAGVSVEVSVLTDAYRHLASAADVVLVEGAGGWRAPLNDSADMADLACALALPVILVVGVRLGCINHALLSAESIRARGLTLAGWVANCVAPETLALDENIQTLAQRLGAPMIARLDWGQADVAGDALAALLT
ncbi:dethiobiotin synthase [Chitinibacteraceae bacterium HSL-7]